MLIEFDPAKNERNLRERGLDFARAGEVDLETAFIEIVMRGDEARLLATGMLGDRLHILCFLPMHGGMRVISFRKANKREVRQYAESRRNLEQES